MPRYYFHFSDGKRTFTDDTGINCAGLWAAREHAKSHLRELRGAMSEQTVQNWALWKMIVVDTDGKTVHQVGFDLTTRKSI